MEPHNLQPAPPASLLVCDCLTPFGRSRETWQALCQGQSALQRHPVLSETGDPVPLALMSSLAEPPQTRWLEICRNLLQDTMGKAPWGGERYPVIVTSSNFGIGQLYAYAQTGRHGALTVARPSSAVDVLAEACGWGQNRIIISNACVSAQLGLIQAARLLDAGLAESVLVFSFDFLSPFVTGGFHSLKILNEEFPRPFCQSESGSIGLGEGAAYAILGGPGQAEWELRAGVSCCESYHMTGNEPDGNGFVRCLAAIADVVADSEVWVKGHGTGTLESGQLEAKAVEQLFPGAPLVSWKGALGHTLGSCGLIELAVARYAMEQDVIPGNARSRGLSQVPQVARESLSPAPSGGVVVFSSAFGGTHAAHWLSRGGIPSPGVVVRSRAEPLRRYLRAVTVMEPCEGLSDEMRQNCRLGLPPAAARRMSALPLQLAGVTCEATIGPEDEVIFLSEFGAVQALEAYLNSFPTPSPLGFQNSTQPGPLSLVLVARRQGLGIMSPLPGGPFVVEQALRLALLSSADNVHLVGGEETGTWMQTVGLASAQAFAFHLVLSRSPEKALGSVTLYASALDQPPSPIKPLSLESLVVALGQRQAFTLASLEGGRLELSWNDG